LACGVGRSTVVARQGRGGHAYLVSTALDALGVCKVPILSVVSDFSLEGEARMASLLTWWDITPDSLFSRRAHPDSRAANQYPLWLTSADDRCRTSTNVRCRPASTAQVVALREWC
jgi:hypothetical protein